MPPAFTTDIDKGSAFINRTEGEILSADSIKTMQTSASNILAGFIAGFLSVDSTYHRAATGNDLPTEFCIAV
ncbi:hypothetical protein EJ03DRAFT_332155 [Teratosphaeria nubilosa]|uniref:Uncharacterized protein n=1 Tax=Teratosphaeria nubilosa TaxID=161662 RepID=A0A6G1KVB3_9PEZI|nr:hypothetical protein EJ03DRAFT_332155 [Teratosphaeria nubilosa]